MGCSPLFGTHFRYLVSSWRSWALSCLILALLRPILSPSCSKMAPRWPNITQHTAKMSQHSLQEQPQDPKKPSKVLYYRRFCGFRHFWQDRAQDPTKVAKMLQKVRQVGHLAPQVGHLGHILAPSWPTWRHLGAKMRPNSHPNGAPDALQIASWAILAPRGSPRTSKVLLEPQFSTIFPRIMDRIRLIFQAAFFNFQPQVRHGGGLARAAHWIIRRPREAAPRRVKPRV